MPLVNIAIFLKKLSKHSFLFDLQDFLCFPLFLCCRWQNVLKLGFLGWLLWFSSHRQVARFSTYPKLTSIYPGWHPFWIRPHHISYLRIAQGLNSLEDKPLEGSLVSRERQKWRDSITLYAITILVKRSKVDWTITYKKDASRKIVIQLVYYVFRAVVDIKKA